MCKKKPRHIHQYIILHSPIFICTIHVLNKTTLLIQLAKMWLHTHSIMSHKQFILFHSQELNLLPQLISSSFFLCSNLFFLQQNWTKIFQYDIVQAVCYINCNTPIRCQSSVKTNERCEDGNDLKDHSWTEESFSYAHLVWTVKWDWSKCKGKAIPIHAWTGPEGSRRMRLPDCKTIVTWRLYGCKPYALATLTPRKYSWYSFLLEAESTPGPSTARRIMSMKNSNGTIGNRTRNLPACTAVFQSTVILRAPPAQWSPQKYSLCWKG